MRFNSETGPYKGLDWIAAENDLAIVTCSTDQGTFKVFSKDKAFRAKTFKGEMAWSNAQRYVNDHLKWPDQLYW